MLFSDILSYAVPLAAVCLSYICGRLQAGHTRRVDANRERYERFYVPFIQFLYRDRMDLFYFSDLKPEYQDQLFDLVFSNVQYLGPDSQKWLLPFFSAYWDIRSASDENSLVSEDYRRSRVSGADLVFTRFADSAVSEASKLSRSLRLPRIGMEFVRESPTKAALQSQSQAPSSKVDHTQ